MAVFDHRRDARVPTDFPVVMRTPFGNEVMRVTNLSFGGMQVVKGLSFVGRRDELELQFRLPSGAGPIICGAEVVYDAEGRLGICFSALTVPQMKVLGTFLTDNLGDCWFN